MTTQNLFKLILLTTNIYDGYENFSSEHNLFHPEISFIQSVTGRFHLSMKISSIFFQLEFQFFPNLNDKVMYIILPIAFF